MKKTVYLLIAILFGILVINYYSCETDPEEVCLQDEICADHFVTACCTEDGKCVYKYNGKEYTEDQLDELESDLGCSAAIGFLKTESQKDDSSAVIEKLKALMSRVKKKCKACK